MAGYLDQYGAGEERRNRIIVRAIVSIADRDRGGRARLVSASKTIIRKAW